MYSCRCSRLCCDISHVISYNVGICIYSNVMSLQHQLNVYLINNIYRSILLIPFVARRYAQHRLGQMSNAWVVVLGIR